MNQENVPFLDLGAWIGRGQAFGMVANQSLAAQAQCLQQIRDSGAYKTTDLKWEEFCLQHIGLSKQRVDELIRNLEEFGATYFRLSEIVRISPEAYRQIAPKIEGEQIEIEGKMVPIVPENAVRIRAAVQRLRTALQDAKRRVLPSHSRLPNLARLLEENVSELTRIGETPLEPEEKILLGGIVDYNIRRLTQIGKQART